jgi:uncharacterized protein YndB with AHSA1/START domain
MAVSHFAYAIDIRTTPETLWSALTEPEFTRQYWFGTAQESEWKSSATWRMLAPDGRVCDSGEIVEIEPRKRLLLTWRHELDPEMHAEGYSRLAYELVQFDEAVELTLRHEMDVADSKFIESISCGWPPILSSLKSLLETGEPLERTRHWPEGY